MAAIVQVLPSAGQGTGATTLHFEESLPPMTDGAWVTNTPAFSPLLWGNCGSTLAPVLPV